MDGTVAGRRHAHGTAPRVTPNEGPSLPPIARLSLFLSLGVLMALVFGCSTTPDKPSLMANMAKEEITVYQLRAMDYEYASQFAQLVSARVSEIVTETDDPSVRERAFQWRMWAMPQARAAAFDQDPFAGAIELWILARQQHQYFTVGNGKAWFGNHQEPALETTRYLEQEAELLLSSVITPDEVDSMRETGREWVERHPIEGQLFVRPTARADLASLVSEDKHGGLKAVGSMEETLRDLSDRITILSVQAPVEARWQAEYLVESLFEERVHDRIDSMVGSMSEMADFLDTFEGTLSAQTSALLKGIENERITVFNAVEDEREAVVAAIENERESILNKLDSQLATATAELDAVGRGLIDHFFVRLIEVLAIMGVAVFLMVLLVLFVLRRRGAGTIDHNPPKE